MDNGRISQDFVDALYLMRNTVSEAMEKELPEYSIIPAKETLGYIYSPLESLINYYFSTHD